MSRMWSWILEPDVGLNNANWRIRDGEWWNNRASELGNARFEKLEQLSQSESRSFLVAYWRIRANPGSV